MSQLGSRSEGDTAAQHVADHNELHRLHNQFDDDAANDGDVLRMVSGNWSSDTPTALGISETSHTHPYVLKSGDVMSGQLTLAGNPVADLGAAPKQYVDAATADTSHTAFGVETLAGTDQVIEVVLDAAPYTITLPPLAAKTLQAILFVTTGTASGTVTIRGNGVEIIAQNPVTNGVITLDDWGMSASVVNVGSQWMVVSNDGAFS